MHNSSNKKLKQQKGKPKMDGLAQPGASKGISKRSHLQNSSTSWIGGGIREPSDPSIREPGGPGTRGPGGPGTRGPGGLSTHWPGGGSSREPSGPCIREPGGPITREHSDPSIREAGGPGTRGSGSLTTRWPGVASTREPGGIISHRPGGSCIREPGGPSTRGPNGIFKRSDLQKSFTRSDPPNHQPIQKRHTKYNWLENEENRNSFSCQSPVTVINQGEEDEQEDTHEINYAETETDTSDDEHEENIGSTSHGVTITRKESRALGETRKSRSKKKNLVFEVDECSGDKR